MALIAACTAPGGRAEQFGNLRFRHPYSGGIGRQIQSAVLVYRNNVSFSFHCALFDRFSIHLFICLTNEVLHLFDALREFLHVAAHFLRRDLRVDLRRADTPVSQHFRERFDGHVVRQTNGRRVAVAT